MTHFFRLVYALPILTVLSVYRAEGVELVLWMAVLGSLIASARYNLLSYSLLLVPIRIGTLFFGCLYYTSLLQAYQFSSHDSIVYWLAHGALLVAVAIAATRKGAWSRYYIIVDCAVVGVCGLYLLGKVHLQLEYGIDALFADAIIADGLAAVDCVLVFFFVSRMDLVSPDRRWNRESIWALSSCYAVLVVIGLGRHGAVYYNAMRLEGQLKMEQWEQARETSYMLVQAECRIRDNKVALTRTLRTAMDYARENVLPKSLIEIGALAFRHQEWGLTIDCHKLVLKDSPGHPTARVRLASALFESGRRKDGLFAHLELALEREDLTENWLALGIAHAKMGQLVEADSAFYRALRLTGSLTEIQAILEQNDVAALHLAEVLPEDLSLHLYRISLYEALLYMRAHEWQVFHHSIEIGKTSTDAPVHIKAISGGGSSWTEETIDVNATIASRRKRGYNIAVVDAASGRVDSAANFDTWENRDEARKMERFLNTIPHNKIIVGTINDEGTSGLTRGVKRALRRAGVQRFPQYWGSHAFVGVMGSAEGSALELISDMESGQNGRVVIGVLPSNIPDSIMNNRDGFEEFLRQGPNSKNGARSILFTGNTLHPAILVAGD